MLAYHRGEVLAEFGRRVSWLTRRSYQETSGWQHARAFSLVRRSSPTCDAVNEERRKLPMVAIEKEYVFDGPEGKASLLDVFEGRRQL